MQAIKHTSKRLLSFLMAVILMLGTTSTASAHAEGEAGGDHEHDATPYAINIYNGKNPNQNGSLAYTITCHEDGTVSGPYDLNDTSIYAVEGDTITLYPKANDGHVLSSIGYVRSDRVERDFTIKEVTAQADGSYTFTMPAYPVTVGAAFYAEDDYYVIRESGTSNAIANVDPLHVLNLGLRQAWIHENTQAISINLELDARILAFEETSGKDMTFRVDIRQVGDSGFVVKGSREFTTEELSQLAADAEKATDDKNREYFLLNNVSIPVYDDVDFEVSYENAEGGQSGYQVYCAAMFTLDGWTNAIGAQNYRWGYSGGDRAFILENDEPIPTAMVYLYNLDPNTYTGMLVAETIDRFEETHDFAIETRYFTPENMTECIGYLAEWPGYESFGELGVDRQPSEKVFKKNIILYCNIPFVLMNALIDDIRDTGANALSSKLTEYGAQRSFEQFYKSQETESEVFTAALALSLLTYEAYNAVPESEYGSHELWSEFKAAYDECKTIIGIAKEQEPSVYNNARLKLQDVYLRIIGKTLLTTDFQFVIEEYDADNYKITVDQSSFPEGLEVEYYWYDASKNESLIIPKDQLYKVRCSISAVDDGPYYGFKEIRLATPAELEYEVSGNSNSISVSFAKYETLPNTPEPIAYTAELYQGEELKQTLSNETAEPLTFTGLESSTQYTVRLYASNIVGRTTYLSEKIMTCGVTVKEDIQHGTVTIEPTNGVVGDTITVTATPDEGYTLTQVGYWIVDENGKAGKLVEVTADENGVYSFAMPASNVVVGAAFQDSSKPVLVSRLNSNKIVDENQEDWSLYIANGDAYLNVGDKETSVYLSVDKRFFDLDGVTMTLEVRQYSDDGYTLAGEKTYSAEELKALMADETTETAYVFESVSIPISKDLIEGYNVYCVVKFNIPSWIDAKGDAMCRWAYTGTDTIIFAESVELPEAMVWLYNLDADSHRGALVRTILEELGIAAGTVNSDNLGQRIGYLIQWPGYEAVEDAYSGNEYDVEYMLMANLTEVQLDRLLDSMQDNNIRVNLKSIPTPWTAGKTFEELFDIMAEEDEVLKAAIALDKVIYTAEALDEETYGASEHWEAFQTALAEAIVALSTDAEEDPEGANLYINAREKLLEAYLKVTNKLALAGELAISCEEAENSQYTLSAKLSDEAATFAYSWTVGQNVASTTDTLTVAAADVYKVKLTITGTERYYGELSASLSVPADPAVTVTAGNASVTVTFTDTPAALNTPAVSNCVAQLYQNGKLVDEKTITAVGTVTFTGLTANTDYEVQAYVSNVVGRSNIQTLAVATTSGSSSSGGSSSVKPPVESIVPEEKPNSTFVDVPVDQYYADAVAWAVAEGITSGTSATTFSPDAVCTRAQTVTFLWRAAGSPEPKTQVCPFEDVSADDYYYNAVLWAVENGITSGTSANTFGPDATVTRAQNVTFLWRWAKSPVSAQTNPFADVSADTYYHNAVIWAVEEGITSGTSADTFSSDAPCLRAQIMTFLYRCMTE